ncbi:MAG TPA: hypothetical protein VFD94_05680 [Jatrophihabitans sp.]|nr:hypothetical protein [Jatrophihabitans sp.]
MSPNPSNRSVETGAAERPQRPVTVDYAVYALIARCVFAVLSALAGYGARPEISDLLAKANRSKNWTPEQLRHAVDSYLRDTLISVLLLVVMVLVMAKFLRDGRNWARWLYLVFAILLTGDLQHVLGFFQYHNVLLRLTTGLTGLAALAALVLMFLPASNNFLRPAAGGGGLFGSMFGPRTARATARPAGAPGPVNGEPVESPAVQLTKPARPSASSRLADPVADPAAQQAGSSAPSAGPSTGRRPPRAKSRRQPTE